ncbi:hypothetical protein [Aldersonia kunmingensis]|uniref:hypothetical protein n=1 Tax=Aldersonia kunmingensis TaxID=408066 RepID=UPI0008345EA4|nr:hypothetical protein [Aldersonia kunmingensis]
MAQHGDVSEIGGIAADDSAVRFGEQPLEQTRAAAAAMRRLSVLLLSLEHEHSVVDGMLAQFAEWERDLSAAAPPDVLPRVGDDLAESRRIYLDHAFDIGSYNPSFPEYRFERIDADSAGGTVTFPIVFEGPPGLVHGGFLGVFFDCIVQQHNCATGRSGKTRSLNVSYRRPTPLATELRFDITRQQTDRAITSIARLLFGDEVLCTGEVDAVALPPDKLVGHRYGKRRAQGGIHQQ